MKVALDPGEDVAKAIEAGLSAFNQRAVGTPSEPVPVQVSVRNSAGAIVGGVVGRVWMDGLYLSTVWIGDELRGQGHGRAMVEAAEAEGRRLGAVQSWLHTLSWQARPFYERLGYVLIGEMPLGGDKHRRFFMRKDLT